MEVQQGIANDYGKDKFAITLNEVDLQRICTQYKITQPPGELDTVTAMLLLSLEAERFVLVQAPKYGRDVEEVRQQIAANRESFATALTMATALSLEETRKMAGLE